MNLLLLTDNDFTRHDTAVINDSRLQHIQHVLGSQPGDTLTVGKLNGNTGTARIIAISEQHVALHVPPLQQAPPPALPLTVILALPRPKMLKRILHNIAEFGIKELHLIHSYKVEKSYWQTPWLQPGAIDNLLTQGLMQARDTVLPQVQLHRRFKPFTEDILPGIIAGQEAFIAHPYSPQPLPVASTAPRVIIIGPEGGFIPYEVQLIAQQGVQAVHMGERIYKVDNALTLLSSRLSCF